jgi:hypothetical protein
MEGMDETGEAGGDADADGGGGSGGIISFLTSVRGIVSTFATLVLAISGLIAALNQAGVIGGEDTETAVTGPTTTPPTTTTQSTSLFGPVTRPNGEVYFDGEQMYVRASLPGRPLLHLADRAEAVADVSLRVRTEWVSGARDYGLGFVCRYENAKNYYLLSVLSGGRYNIVRYRNGQGRSLTGGIQTGTGAAEGANDIYAKCTGDDPANLTLTVNGRELPTVRDDDGLGAGIVGLRVGTSESFVVVRFERFDLREL